MSAIQEVEEDVIGLALIGGLAVGGFLLWQNWDFFSTAEETAKDLTAAVGDYISTGTEFAEGPGIQALGELGGILTGNEDKEAEAKTVELTKVQAKKGNFMAKASLNFGEWLGGTFGGARIEHQKHGRVHVNDFSDPFVWRHNTWALATQIENRDNITAWSQVQDEANQIPYRQATQGLLNAKGRLMSFAEAFNKMRADSRYIIDTQMSRGAFGYREMGDNEDADDVGGGFLLWKGKRMTRDTRIPDSELAYVSIRNADDASVYLIIGDDGDQGDKDTYGKRVSLGLAGYLDTTVAPTWRYAKTDDAEKKNMIDALNQAELPIGYLGDDTTAATEVQFLNFYGIKFTRGVWSEKGIPLTQAQKDVGFTGTYEFM
jgi:hypothetical protein